MYAEGDVMIHGRMRKTTVMGGVFLAVVLAAAGRAGGVELAPRYIDPQHGFSIRPPLGADRTRGYSASRLVRWSQRDARTGAIAWTLAVRREAGRGKLSLLAFAKALSAKLAKVPDVTVESVRQGKLAGRDVLHVRTQRGARTRRWQYEVWTVVDAERFLALAINGPLTNKETLEATCLKVAETLRLTDPKSLQAARKENLKRGLAFLKGLTAARLAAAVSAEPRWYLYRQKGRDIGFLHVATAAVRRGSTQWFEVRTFARLAVRSDQVMLLRRSMSTTADRSQERWTETARVLRGPKLLRTMTEEGSRQGGAITCKVAAGGKARTNTKPMPAPTAAHYLPRALGPLLPRLADLAAPGAMAFAAYTTAANDFDMRTFAVIGPEKTTLGGRTYRAVRATDQVAADSEPATLHVQTDGTVLRMVAAGGIVMELATREAVLRRFPNAESSMKQR